MSLIVFFLKEAGQILKSALLVLIMKSEAMKAFPHSHGLKVSRSWSHGLRVSSVAAQEEGTSSLLGTCRRRGSKKSNICRRLKVQPKGGAQ